MQACIYTCPLIDIARSVLSYSTHYFCLPAGRELGCFVIILSYALRQDKIITTLDNNQQKRENLQNCGLCYHSGPQSRIERKQKEG